MLRLARMATSLSAAAAGAGYGATRTTGGDAGVGSSETNSRVYGIVGGIDYRLSRDSRVGFAVGGAGTNFSLASGIGSGRSDLFQSALYGGTRSARLMWRARLLIPGRTSPPRALSPSRAPTGSKAASRPMRYRRAARPAVATPFVNVTPYVALQATTFYLPGYNETATAGINQFALGYAPQNVTATRSELGSRFDKAYLLNEGSIFTLRSRLAWAHDYNQSSTATATFQALPGTTFTVNGAQPAADAILATARDEVAQRVLARRHLRRRILAQHHQLRRQGHPALYVVRRPLGKQQILEKRLAGPVAVDAIADVTGDEQKSDDDAGGATHGALLIQVLQGNSIGPGIVATDRLRV